MLLSAGVLFPCLTLEYRRLENTESVRQKNRIFNRKTRSCLFGVPANITVGDFVGYRGGGNPQEGGGQFLQKKTRSGSAFRLSVAFAAVFRRAGYL